MVCDRDAMYGDSYRRLVGESANLMRVQALVGPMLQGCSLSYLQFALFSCWAQLNKCPTPAGLSSSAEGKCVAIEDLETMLQQDQSKRLKIQAKTAKYESWVMSFPF